MANNNDYFNLVHTVDKLSELLPNILRGLIVLIILDSGSVMLESCQSNFSLEKKSYRLSD